MGNYASCALSGGEGRYSKAAKVIFPGGEVRRVDWPANAAELMLDAPNHFLVSTREMRVGRRFSPLAADEELEAGAAYLMLPMKRANSVATAADMEALWRAAKEGAQQSSGGQARIIPEAAPPPGGDVEDVEGALTGVFMRRLSVCRSRKPSLETIAEETTIISTR